MRDIILSQEERDRMNKAYNRMIKKGKIIVMRDPSKMWPKMRKNYKASNTERRSNV